MSSWAATNPPFGSGDMRHETTCQCRFDRTHGRCRKPRMSQPSSWILSVSADGTEMSGWVNGLDQAKVTLRKQP